MRKIMVDGVRVPYREQDSGPVVILLHSSISSGSQWRGVADELSDRYRLVMPDIFGYGEAEQWPGPQENQTNEREAVLMRGLITQLGEPVHLAGLSQGGGVAMRLVLKDNIDILSLSLIEPISAFSLLQQAGEQQSYQEQCDIAQKFIAKVGQGVEEEAWLELMDGMNTPGTWDALSDEVRGRLREMTKQTTLSFHANLNDRTTLAECASIKLPTLAVFGDATYPNCRRITEIVADQIPGCGLECIPGAGHMSPATHPEALAKLLEQHFVSNSGSN